jgi:hypothetical protein
MADGTGDGSLKNALIPNKPYLHFWRAQADKIGVAIVVAGLLTWGTLMPDHPWLESARGWTGQAVLLLLLLLRRGTWTDPENGDGPKPAEYRPITEVVTTGGNPEPSGE